MRFFEKKILALKGDPVPEAILTNCNTSLL